MAANLKNLIFNDFKDGWATVTGALSLPLTQSPAMQNVIPLPGRLRFRGGTVNTVALPYPADAAFPFNDSSGGKHYAIWAGGNLYDCVSGTPVLIESAVYTPGAQVGHCCLNDTTFGGSLFWSTGYNSATNPSPTFLRYWDGGSGHGAVTSAGGTGVINPPASGMLFVYLNCIFALAPYWGAPATSNVWQPNAVANSNVDTPDVWTAANAFTVGPTDGGVVIYGAQLGIANTGVAPQRDLVIFRNDQNVYGYQGAPPSLVESALNCPVGCADPDSVQYVPQASALGAFIFLGTDGQLWMDNGIQAVPVSTNITDDIVGLYKTTVANNPTARFRSGYNDEWQYYWVDINGTQIGYRWQTGACFPMTGWPTGPAFSTLGFSGTPGYFVASNSPSNPHLAQIAVDGQADNGEMPVTYWSGPQLHGGDPRLYKDFQWATVGAYNTGVTYSVTGQSNQRLDGTFMESMPSILSFPGSAPSPSGDFILGSSVLGGPDVLGEDTQTGPPVVVLAQTRMVCAVPIEDDFVDEGDTESLKGNSVQFTIAWSGGAPAFDLIQLEAQYAPLGYFRGAGLQYNPTAGATTQLDDFEL